jgi:hypothetical protein
MVAGSPTPLLHVIGLTMVVGYTTEYAGMGRKFNLTNSNFKFG